MWLDSRIWLDCESVWDFVNLDSRFILDSVFLNLDSKPLEDSKSVFESCVWLAGHSKILDEKSGLCSRERGDKTEASIDYVSDKLPDLSLKAECPPRSTFFTLLYHTSCTLSTPSKLGVIVR